MFRLLYDGCDSNPRERFATREEAKAFIKANSPQIWRQCQYQIDVAEISEKEKKEKGLIPS